MFEKKRIQTEPQSFRIGKSNKKNFYFRAFVFPIDDS